jgi:negative regulator of sigma E activity
MKTLISILKCKEVIIYEDDYEQGEGELVNSYNFSYNKRVQTITEILKYITNYVRGEKFDMKNWEYEDGTARCSFLVDEDNTEPSNSQIKAWKEGKEKLYIAEVNVSITTVVGSYPTTDKEFEAEGITGF